MTVQELIDKLSAFDRELEVEAEVAGYKTESDPMVIVDCRQMTEPVGDGVNYDVVVIRVQGPDAL